ncbi:MAG: Energy-coupling factor transporter transmembrane protein EcfT [Smithella sp. PtaU1.Bin162]|nr:MAG: Energy-coupling factor transporter transmembrane protein EcfT [Smithella sp. PtaU1.Bin162]
MITLGQYINNNSFGHRLDARVKILATVILSLLIFQARGWEIFLISSFVFIVCFICRLNFFSIWKALQPLVWFAVLLFALHLFFTDGTVLFTAPYLPVEITAEGLSRGLIIAWQFIALALCGVLLTMVTSPSDLVHGLTYLLGPLKYLRVPVQDIAVMVSMSLRFVPTLLEEYDRIKQAQIARGSAIETGRPARKIKSLAALIIPLMVSAFRRADDLTEAMEARGYARGPRTTLNQQHFGREEVFALLVLGVLLSLVLTSQFLRAPFP